MTGKPPHGLRVGAATADITPARNLPNYAGAECWPDERGLPLLAQAVVMNDGTKEVALVVCDVTLLDRSMLLRVRDSCARRAGLSPDHVIVAATHTHHAPATSPGYVDVVMPDPCYLDYLEDQAVGAVLTAKQRLTPAAFVVAGTAASPGFELNRRSIRPDGGIAFQQWHPEWPSEGPTDPTLTFLGFESHSGEPLAIITSYSCHNTTSNPFEGRSFTPDVFGHISAGLREGFPTVGSAPVMSGAQGNLEFGDPATKQRLLGDEFARTAGVSCAQAIQTAFMGAARTVPTDIEFARAEVEISDRPLAESTFCGDGCRGTAPEERKFARERYEPERRAVEARGTTTYPVELAALAVGNAALITNPSELFVEFGLQIREQSPFGTTLVTSLTNGHCGYVPTNEAFEHGGYETHRSVYVSRLKQDAGETIAALSGRLLRKLHTGAGAPTRE